MKTSKTCPKCQNKNLFYSSCVMDRGEGNVAMCLAIRRSDPIEAKELGRFEIYSCKSCGYTEFYVAQPEELEQAEKLIEEGGEFGLFM